MAHYHVRVLLFGPLLSKKLAQVDGGQGANLTCLLYHVFKIHFVFLFAQLPLFVKSDSRFLAVQSAFSPFFHWNTLCNFFQLFDHFLSDFRKFVKILDNVSDFFLKTWVPFQFLFYIRLELGVIRRWCLTMRKVAVIILRVQPRDPEVFFLSLIVPLNTAVTIFRWLPKIILWRPSPDLLPVKIPVPCTLRISPGLFRHYVKLVR